MGILSGIRNAFGADAVETKAIVGTDYLGRTNPVFRIENNQVVPINDGNRAEMFSVFYTILNSIQTTAKSIQWSAYSLDGNDEIKTKLPNHPLGKLMYRPNPDQTMADFMVQFLGNMFHEGKVYILVLRAGGNSLNAGKPLELRIMPRTTYATYDGTWLNRVVDYRIPTATGEPEIKAKEDVLCIKKGDGISPIKAAALLNTSIDQGIKQRIKLLGNGGPKQAVYKDEPNTEGFATQEQEDAFKRKMSAPGQFAISNAKLGTVQVGLSPVDLDILNSIQADAGMLADMLGYPSILLSGNKSSTYNNVSEAQKALYTNCILPYFDDLRGGLNHWLGAAYNDAVFMDYDTSNIEVLKPNQAALIAAAVSADFLTINEKRKMAGFAALKDKGDGFIRSAGMQYFATIDEADTTTADAYAAGDAGVTGN